MAVEKDVEAQNRSQIGHFDLVFKQGILTPEVIDHHYSGSGTREDPYVVHWLPNDTRNPQNFSGAKKWGITATVAIATLAVAFVSSAYTGGIDQIIEDFGCSEEVAVLGLSLFVLGFAVGPLIWAPMSELFGRQILFTTTYAALTFFNAGACGAQNISTLIVLRFFAGAFGSSPLTNAGGVIADMFAADQRGIAMSLFAVAPFMGPVLGPIVGGFVGETVGWRWVEGVMAIFTGTLWIIGTFYIPETYPPVLLRKRAAALSKLHGKVYKSKMEVDQGDTKFGHIFATSLQRPWLLLFREPIVFLLTIYMAIIYGILYMLFSAFPIVFEENRGWSQGISGLAFLGVAVGMVGAVTYAILDNKRYIKISKAHDGFAPPESRLPPAMVGAVAIVIGLFWFAWTNSPSVQFIVPIAAGAPFGFGMVLVFLSIFNYLIDAYVIFAASVLAANSVLRSLFGAAFPLFTTYMYDNLGIHWASSVPAFLALACMPFPWLFWKYGRLIREKSKYAAQAANFMKQLQNQRDQAVAAGGSDSSTTDVDVQEQEALDLSYEDEEADRELEKERKRKAREEHEHEEPAFEEMKTEQETRGNGSALVKTKSYEANPYDIDRVATRDSFKPVEGRSRASSRASGR